MSQAYFSKDYVVRVTPEKAAQDLRMYGTEVIANSVYHIRDLTVTIRRFAEGGPKCVLIIAGHNDRERTIDDLFRDLGSDPNERL